MCSSATVDTLYASTDAAGHIRSADIHPVFCTEFCVYDIYKLQAHNLQALYLIKWEFSFTHSNQKHVVQSTMKRLSGFNLQPFVC